MINKTITILFFFVQISICQINILNKLKMYVEKNFNLKLDSSYVITTHTKQDVYNYWISNYQKHEFANKNLNTCNWQTNAEYFIDSLYSKDSAGEFNGVFLDYFGDSLSGYRIKFYKHGKKDSVDIRFGCLGSKNVYRAKRIYRYKNGVEHGIAESFNNHGIRRWLTKYVNGEVVDTSYEWYDNGNLIAKRYHKNGKIVWEKCYEKDGETEMECDF